jgi:hypothetical protein
MIYQFNGTYHELSHFQLNVDADSGHTFFDLHQALQSALGFEPLHLASFIVPPIQGLPQIEITLLSCGEHRSRLLPMQNTLIGDIMTPGRRFIYYVFDLLNDRFINLQLTGTNMEKNLKEPSIILNQGEIPIQAMDEEMAGELFDLSEKKTADPNYGVLNDYFEIFGEMEEYVL